ncbi:hypothetical protein [Aurantimonas sp. VKM B-3413]|uniref:hypothetical protein n=1 Tax=Aurantimonas sp. VKM B-3413 TaxID=2779401 RepID=UPI001E46B156|nr:hypothetical protein [Aurantimonas sp. VKM B-3413]MCB8838480.1 hypothetical protein [Aurantimonas sp. VKM B-3413]
MSEKSKRYVALESAHGQIVVIIPLMVTHIASRGASEADVFFVGGASVPVKGSAEGTAEAIFG